MFKHAPALTAIAALAIAVPAAVYAYEVDDTKTTPFTEEEKRQVEIQMETLGYEIVKIETEDDELEVYATKGDKLFEIELDRESGEVLEIEEEDD